MGSESRKKINHSDILQVPNMRLYQDWLRIKKYLVNPSGGGNQLFHCIMQFTVT